MPARLLNSIGNNKTNMPIPIIVIPACSGNPLINPNPPIIIKNNPISKNMFLLKKYPVNIKKPITKNTKAIIAIKIGKAKTS
mgnify:CR=1 FL=1